MNENMKSNCHLVTKWLNVLSYAAIASLINSLVNHFPFVPAGLTTWISRGITATVILCMFRLAPVHPRYQKAGIYRGVMLVLTLITSIIFASSFLSLAASVCSIMAVYQEYSAHSDLVAEKDPKLSRQWHSLFNWGIISGLLVAGGSVVAVLIVAMLEMDAVRAAGLIVGILSIPQRIIDVVHLLYLRKMIGYFQDEAEVYRADV